MQKLFILLFFASGILYSTSCSKEDDDKGKIIAKTTQSDLTADEEKGLIFMREEEKLARDVYVKLNETHNMQIFTNISASEQVHMDSILSLLTIYGLPDPASSEAGVFNDTMLQAVYNDLVSQGSASILDAMKVGALIEELDIRDLRDYMALTAKSDILAAYEFLSCGSRNHLRSFNKQVEKNGGTYTALYLSQEEYEVIASGEHEQCGK